MIEVAFDPATELPFGVWPEDPNEVPQWMAERHARAAALGLVLPSYKTRAELEAAIDRAKQRAEPAAASAPPPAPAVVRPSPDPEPEPETVVELLPEWPPAVAAKRFAAWLRAQIATETVYPSDELTSLYERFSAEQSRIPAPENTVRGHLKTVPGITRVRDDRYIQGKRVRNFVWQVVPAANPKATVYGVNREAKPSETVNRSLVSLVAAA